MDGTKRNDIKIGASNDCTKPRLNELKDLVSNLKDPSMYFCVF